MFLKEGQTHASTTKYSIPDSISYLTGDT